MYTYSKCPACGHTTFKPFLSVTDHSVSKETFNIVSCTECQLKFTNPIPEHKDLWRYYKSESYISHSNTRKGVVAKLYHLVRSYTLKKKLKLISSIVSRGTILDYGCGIGSFLNTCKDAGWNTFGIEPDGDAVKLATESGAKVFISKEEIPGEVSFDIITMWHVLEHVTDLQATLKWNHDRLKKDGYLIIAVPNHTSFDAGHYHSTWAAYDVPRHLYHFTPETLQYVVSNASFTLTGLKPMKFDSFYVSMLSEKYKTGSINYPKAVLNGLKSNLASKSPADYSSVIYIFKKL